MGDPCRDRDRDRDRGRWSSDRGSGIRAAPNAERRTPSAGTKTDPTTRSRPRIPIRSFCMSDPLRVVIVDDEPLARAVVREYLGAHPGVEVVAECGNGFEAVKAVTELSPDLAVPRRADAEVERLRGARAARAGGAGHLHDRLRSIRAARVRGARGRLPAQAVRRGAFCRGAVEGAGAPAREGAGRSGCADGGPDATPCDPRGRSSAC